METSIFTDLENSNIELPWEHIFKSALKNKNYELCKKIIEKTNIIVKNTYAYRLLLTTDFKDDGTKNYILLELLLNNNEASYKGFIEAISKRYLYPEYDSLCNDIRKMDRIVEIIFNSYFHKREKILNVDDLKKHTYFSRDSNYDFDDNRNIKNFLYNFIKYLINNKKEKYESLQYILGRYIYTEKHYTGELVMSKYGTERFIGKYHFNFNFIQFLKNKTVMQDKMISSLIINNIKPCKLNNFSCAIKIGTCDNKYFDILERFIYKLEKNDKDTRIKKVNDIEIRELHEFKYNNDNLNFSKLSKEEYTEKINEIKEILSKITKELNSFSNKHFIIMKYLLNTGCSVNKIYSIFQEQRELSEHSFNFINIFIYLIFEQGDIQNIYDSKYYINIYNVSQRSWHSILDFEKYFKSDIDINNIKDNINYLIQNNKRNDFNIKYFIVFHKLNDEFIKCISKYSFAIDHSEKCRFIRYIAQKGTIEMIKHVKSLGISFNIHLTMNNENCMNNVEIVKILSHNYTKFNKNLLNLYITNKKYKTLEILITNKINGTISITNTKMLLCCGKFDLLNKLIEIDCKFETGKAIKYIFNNNKIFDYVRKNVKNFGILEVSGFIKSENNVSKLNYEKINYLMSYKNYREKLKPDEILHRSNLLREKYFIINEHIKIRDISNIIFKYIVNI